jgi:hypothetical protein
MFQTLEDSSCGFLLVLSLHLSEPFFLLPNEDLTVAQLMSSTQLMSYVSNAQLKSSTQLMSYVYNGNFLPLGVFL